MILDPRGFSVIEWTSRVNPYLGRYGTIPILESPERWQEWAAAVIQLSGISQYNPPSPFQFSDWLDWAEAFNRTVPSYI